VESWAPKDELASNKQLTYWLPYIKL